MLKSSNVGILLVNPQPLTLYAPVWLLRLISTIVEFDHTPLPSSTRGLTYIACVGHISSQILHPTQFS